MSTVASRQNAHFATGLKGADVSAVASALLWRNPKTKRPRRVLLTPAPALQHRRKRLRCRWLTVAPTASSPCMDRGAFFGVEPKGSVPNGHDDQSPVSGCAVRRSDDGHLRA